MKSESICLIIALASKNAFKMHQLDLPPAFLNGELEEAVYVKQPEGFVVKGQDLFVCKLRRLCMDLSSLLDARIKHYLCS